jgi:arabinofuranosyltransferase
MPPRKKKKSKKKDKKLNPKYIGWGILGFLSLMYLVAVVKTAWMSDDAYIAFRVADNFFHGNGLTWNIAERVQVFTSPLWTLLLTFYYRLTGEMYYTATVISVLVSSLAVGLMVWNRKVTPNIYAAGLAMLVFVFSKSFTDYSTSGLENPMIYLCLGAFITVLVSGELSLKRLFWLTLIGAFGVFNRMDNLLFYFPALVYGLWVVGRQSGFIKTIGLMALGLTPFVLWEIFSLIYFGFPFPNTAYAKLGAGFPFSEVLTHGFQYFERTLKYDVITLIAIAGGLGVAVYKRKDWQFVTLAAGVFLYLLYILKVGGDFMDGRFFSGPLFVSAVLVARGAKDFSNKAIAGLAVTVIVIGFLSPFTPITSPKAYKDVYYDGHIPIDWDSGIADERGYYYDTTGLLNNIGEKKVHQNEGAMVGLAVRYEGDIDLILAGATGYQGFYVGPDTYILDFHALGDAFLAHTHLARHYGWWRPGHIEHVLPAGYTESVLGEESLIEDENLREMHNVINTIVRGPIWNKERFITIAKYNLGFYDHLKEPADPENFRYMDTHDIIGRIKELAVDPEARPWVITLDDPIWDYYSTGWPASSVDYEWISPLSEPPLGL